jgi:hypothetical protein
LSPTDGGGELRATTKGREKGACRGGCHQKQGKKAMLRPILTGTSGSGRLEADQTEEAEWRKIAHEPSRGQAAVEKGIWRRALTA